MIKRGAEKLKISASDASLSSSMDIFSFFGSVFLCDVSINFLLDLISFLIG